MINPLTSRYSVTVFRWHLVNIRTAFVLLGLDILVSASSCIQSMNGCMRILDVPAGSKQQFPRCREVAKFLNCIQEHCADSLSPCEMDAARQVMLAKFDDTGIQCDSRKLLSPHGDCGSSYSSSNARIEALDSDVSDANAANTNHITPLGSARYFSQSLCKYWSLKKWVLIIFIGSLFWYF